MSIQCTLGNLRQRVQVREHWRRLRGEPHEVLDQEAVQQLHEQTYMK